VSAAGWGGGFREKECFFAEVVRKKNTTPSKTSGVQAKDTTPSKTSGVQAKDTRVLIKNKNRF